MSGCPRRDSWRPCYNEHTRPEPPPSLLHLVKIQ
nr:MAG TPA: hypothetical protein [Caudoviricetes sp.]